MARLKENNQSWPAMTNKTKQRTLRTIRTLLLLMIIRRKTGWKVLFFHINFLIQRAEFVNAQNVIKILTPASAVKFVDLKKFGRVYFLTNFCPKVKSSKENFTNQNYRNITLHWIRTEHRVSGSPCLLHPKRQLYVHKRNGLTIPVFLSWKSWNLRGNLLLEFSVEILTNRRFSLDRKS